jgi:hypothetical protein
MNPNDPDTCQRCGSSSPWQVVAMPVGPTGGESPQARASRHAPIQAAAKHEDARIAGVRRTGSRTAG